MGTVFYSVLYEMFFANIHHIFFQLKIYFKTWETKFPARVFKFFQEFQCNSGVAHFHVLKGRPAVHYWDAFGSDEYWLIELNQIAL